MLCSIMFHARGRSINTGRLPMSPRPGKRPWTTLYTLCRPRSWATQVGQWPSSKSVWMPFTLHLRAAKKCSVLAGDTSPRSSLRFCNLLGAGSTFQSGAWACAVKEKVVQWLQHCAFTIIGNLSTWGIKTPIQLNPTILFWHFLLFLAWVVYCRFLHKFLLHSFICLLLSRKERKEKCHLTTNIDVGMT